jgi:hypothetical protein
MKSIKKIKFFSGFPRAGNTVFSCILNQNPKILSTAKSILPDVYYQIEQCKNYTIYKNFPDQKSFDNILKNIHKNYYNNFKQEYIIERGEWITPYNYNILKKYFNQNIKIVILVRNIIDILKSHIDLCNKNPNFYFNTNYNSLDKSTLYKSEIEEKCDMIMQKGSYMDLILYSIKYVKEHVDKKNYMFVDYDDFVNQPKKTLNKIYKFYEIPKFNHDLNNVSQLKINNISYNDSIFGAPMHEIKTNILKVKNYDHIKLPKRVIDKYSNLEIWK